MLIKYIISSCTSHFGLKLFSLFIGFGLWFVLGQTVGSSISLTVPLTFYNTLNSQIKSAEKVAITLSGIRKDLWALDQTQLAIHIDASQLKSGKNIVNLSQEHLLIPEHIKILHYNPANIIITKM